MPVVILRDPLSGVSFPAVESYRMFLYTETGSVSFSVPVAPREISYGGIGQEWVSAERSGDTPLLLRKGVKLKTISFTTLITDVASMWSPQSDHLHAMETLANGSERVLVIVERNFRVDHQRLTAGHANDDVGPQPAALTVCDTDFGREIAMFG